MSDVNFLLNREIPAGLLSRLAAACGLTVSDLDGPTVEIIGTAVVEEDRYIPASWSGPAEGGGHYVVEVRVTDAYLDRDPSPCVSDAELIRELSDFVFDLDDKEILRGCFDDR